MLILVNYPSNKIINSIVNDKSTTQQNFLFCFLYQEKEQQLKEKAQAMTRENVRKALDNFAERQMSKEQTVSN